MWPSQGNPYVLPVPSSTLHKLLKVLSTSTHEQKNIARQITRKILWLHFPYSFASLTSLLCIVIFSLLWGGCVCGEEV